MHPLKVELYAERYQRQLDSLLQHDLDVITKEIWFRELRYFTN